GGGLEEPSAALQGGLGWRPGAGTAGDALVPRGGRRPDLRGRLGNCLNWRGRERRGTGAGAQPELHGRLRAGVATLGLFACADWTAEASARRNGLLVLGESTRRAGRPAGLWLHISPYRSREGPTRFGIRV